MSSTRGHKFKFSIGEHVLCFEPDPTKARVLYDAKVLEARVRIDKYGRNQVEYHIHFLRWNQSWDRLVSESLILRKNDENNHLMRRLADIARRLKTNRQRKRKIDIILKRAFPEGLFRGGNASTDDDDEGSSGKEAGSSTDTTNNSRQNKSNNALEDGSDISDDDDDDEYDDDNDESMDDETDDDDTKPAIDEDVIPEEDYVDSDHVDVPLPHVLMDRLDLDWYLINKEKKLVKLPAEPNVISVLESYVRHFAVTTLSGSPDKSRSCNKKTKFASEKSIPLCKEVVDGLRILFDFTLPMILLYGAERDQLKHILETFKPKHPPLSPPETITPVLKKEPQSPIAGKSERRKIPAILQLKNITSPPDLIALSGARRSSSRLQSHSPTSEPRAKVPKILSPRSPVTSPITRTEAKSSTSHDEFPSRRVTRHSISECSRKSIDQPPVGRRSSLTKPSPDGAGHVNGVDKNTNSRNKDKKTVDVSLPSADDNVKVTRSGRRHSGTANSNTANVSSTVYTSPAHGQSLFERLETIVKEAKQSTPPSSSKKKCKKRLSLRKSPPASTAQGGQAAPVNESKPTISSGSSATSSGNISTVQFRNWKESQLNEALCWQLLPTVYAQMTPPSPSVVYGAHHLLRLFVKLPSLLGHMKMSQQKLDCLLKHLHLFLEFLASKHEDLLPSKVYVRDV